MTTNLKLQIRAENSIFLRNPVVRIRSRVRFPVFIEANAITEWIDHTHRTCAVEFIAKAGFHEFIALVCDFAMETFNPGHFD